MFCSHERNRAGLAAFLAVATGAAGCGIDSETRSQMAEQESILAPLLANSMPTPAEAAAWAADPHDADKRARGVVLLSNAPFGGETVYVEQYENLLTDEASTVRAAAARALGLHGRPEQMPKVAGLLADPERLVRLEAAKALQRVHNPAVAPLLIDRLDPAKETEPDVRTEAATALGQYPQTRVLQALITSLDDDSFAVSRASAESLRLLTGQPLGDDRKEWTTWAADTKEPFAAQKPYFYPVFSRDKRWLDYVPFAAPVPNEESAQPAGVAPLGGGAS